MTQEVHGFIGCPGSGKTTLANTYDPKEWVICTLDDLRQTMWPPHRGKYWELRDTDKGAAAQRVLHSARNNIMTSALENGFSFLSPDVNVIEKNALDIINLAAIFDITVRWFVLDVPLHILQQRNAERCLETLRVPSDYLIKRYEEMWDTNAWWRSHDVEIIKHHPTEIEADEPITVALNKLIHDFPKSAQLAVYNEKQRDFFVNELNTSLSLGAPVIKKVVYKKFGWKAPA